MKKEQNLLSMKPEKIKQKAIAPLKTGGEIRIKKAICHFDYYLKDSGGKGLPRVYLCEHRTMADIFLEAALFDPKKNILCVSKAEWESSPEEVRRSLRKFEKVFREPYGTTQSFVRQLFHARQAGKSILLPVTEDARGMDREPYLNERAIVRLCSRLEMSACTVTFRDRGAKYDKDTGWKEPTGGGSRSFGNLNDKGVAAGSSETERTEERSLFYLDVKPLFTPEELSGMPEREAETAVSASFSAEVNSSRQSDFLEKKRLMMREFLKSELNVAVPVEICQIHAAGTDVDENEIRMRDYRPLNFKIQNSGAKDSERRNSEAEDWKRQNIDARYHEQNGSVSILCADMTGITLETEGARYHRGPGALKSLAVYPGKQTETGERGTILIYPYFDKTFYLFTMQNEDAEKIQAATEQMYEIVSAQI